MSAYDPQVEISRCASHVQSSEAILGRRTLANEKMVNRVGRHKCGVTLWQMWLRHASPNATLTASRSRQTDSNTTSGANASIGSRIRYLRHPTLLLTRAADEEWNLWSSSSRHLGAAVARNTRAIGRELLRTVMTLLNAGVPQFTIFRSTRLTLVRQSALLQILKSISNSLSVSNR